MVKLDQNGQRGQRLRVPGFGFGSGFRVHDFGNGGSGFGPSRRARQFRVKVSSGGFRVQAQGFGYTVPGSEFRDSGRLGFRGQGFRIWNVPGFRFRVSGFEFRVVDRFRELGLLCLLNDIPVSGFGSGFRVHD